MQKTFDWLYQKSLSNEMEGINLYDLILSRDNILLAYRNIKSNTGSHTKGIDGLTIEEYKIKQLNEFIEDIKERLPDYQPQAVRRVEIAKPNGKKRPLGIPTMQDRLLQQMFKQILEPICEAKFHKHSYGFRSNRSTHDALERCCFLININKNHYVVDIDIKSFFDNINHTKLIKQLWNIGVKDKRVLAIIYKMLKAPIKGIGVPQRGTPQGGILSPLLSNAVLNDIDWWLSDQWETFESANEYTQLYRNRLLKTTTNLKEMHGIRYADDLRVYTNSYKNAVKIYHAVTGYLKNELKLDISPEKSKITNLRKRSSEFLGFELKAAPKRKKYVANTFVSKKSKSRIKTEIRKRVKEIQNHTTAKVINNYNSYVLGIQNYYRIATHVNIDFKDVSYRILKTLYNRLNTIAKYETPRSPPPLYKRLYRNNYRTYTFKNISLYPLMDIKWKQKTYFNQKICNYTNEGRELVHKELKGNVTSVIYELLVLPLNESTVEYRDNLISKYSMQMGRCAITQLFLTAEEIYCHHIIPITDGGTDKFNNLVIVKKDVDELIHCTNKEKIKTLLSRFNLNKKQLTKLNKYRKECNLTEIE